MKRFGLLLVLVCLSAGGTSASVDPADLPARAKGATRVVIGTVGDVQARFDTSEWGDQLIVTDAVVSVDENLKGSFSSSVVVTVEGGSIGGLTLDVSDMPSLKKGERAVFFLENARQGGMKPNGRGHGVLKIDDSDRIVGSNITVDDVKRVVREAR